MTMPSCPWVFPPGVWKLHLRSLLRAVLPLVPQLRGIPHRKMKGQKCPSALTSDDMLCHRHGSITAILYPQPGVNPIHSPRVSPIHSSWVSPIHSPVSIPRLLPIVVPSTGSNSSLTFF
ncbi:hypothetical protein P7K49_034645 [Saguinus oedipus]|uniref:Uncharacterized protein n=1 Tax=Saguinus oedipus TaxID=9490 RepID=A0ABQ9TVC7_SAGOE|nr:hypothetical protein P7K49_034645 [Saguinus oedipus]